MNRKADEDSLVLDALTEVMNIGVGKAAAIMNTMLDSHVTLTVPVVRLLSLEKLLIEAVFPSDVAFSAVEMKYTGSFNGFVELVFDTVSAGKLVDRLSGVDSMPVDDFDSLRSGTLCEIGNIVINAVLGTMANILDVALSFSVPFYHEGRGSGFINNLKADSASMVLLTKTTFTISELSVTGDFAVFFTFSSYENLRSGLLKIGQD